MPPPPGARRPTSTAGWPARDSATSAGSPASTRPIGTCWPSRGARRGGRRGRRRADRGPGPPRSHLERAARARRCSSRCCSGPQLPARADCISSRLAAGGRGDRRGARGRAGSTRGLKWPNDVVVDDRKLAGILAEADGAGAVVVGMGLNVRGRRVPGRARGHRDRVRPARGRPGRPVASCSSRGCARSTRGSTTLDGVVAAAAAALGDARPAGARRARPASSSTGVATALTDEGFLVVRTDDGARARSSPPATSSTSARRRDVELLGVEVAGGEVGERGREAGR